jgi:hypothetical protein
VNATSSIMRHTVLGFPELYGHFGRKPGDQSALDELIIPATPFPPVDDYRKGGHVVRLIASFAMQ